jgi:hypothetical protein
MFLAASAPLLVAPAFPGPPRPTPARVESIAGPDGRAIFGKIAGDAKTGFRFEPSGGEPSLSLEQAGVVTIEGGGVGAASGYPPMRVLLGLEQQVSGRLGSVDDAKVILEDGPSGQAVTVARGGARGLAQRPGEALVLQDGFETLDPARWSRIGEPDMDDGIHLAGSRSLRIPAGGSAVTCRLAEPVASGRLEVAFHDPGKVAPGQQWFVDLLFKGPSGDETVRAVLDCSEESLAVQTSGGPALAVQRLARKPGWHRLGLRFGPEMTDLAVDGDELAHGRGPGGPLLEIRLANRTTGEGAIPRDLAVHFDDLRLVRLAEPVGGLEVAPSVDDVRLVDGGDQIFGQLKSADADAVLLSVDGRDVRLPWTEVAELDFRRVAAQSRAIEGLLVRVEWRSAPGTDPRDTDQAEGALLTLNDTSLTLATPYAGDLVIPRERLRKLKPLGRGRRIVLDATAHHLGNNVSKDPQPLDPPQPEGGTLERTFTLESVPDGPSFLVLDVIQVVGEANSLQFSDLVRKGEIRTNLKLNGKPFDYLNRHVITRNETPERVRVPIPAGTLRPGPNTLRFEQTGKAGEPEELDDLGILTIALEFGDPNAPKP